MLFFVVVGFSLYNCCTHYMPANAFVFRNPLVLVVVDFHLLLATRSHVTLFDFSVYLRMKKKKQQSHILFITITAEN